jgi:hypothetical protein
MGQAAHEALISPNAHFARGRIAEGMYGRVKSALEIENRRVKGDSGPATYEWRLPKS